MITNRLRWPDHFLFDILTTSDAPEPDSAFSAEML